MKKWIIPILMLLLITTVQAGFFADVEGGINSSKIGMFVAVKGWFTRTGCIPVWVPGISSCLTNDTNILVYTDTNSCGVSTGLPADNGTFNAACNFCSQDLSKTDITTCVLFDGNETHNISVYDADWIDCCNVTGLASDCYEDDTTNLNKTYFETELCTRVLNVEVVAIAIILIGVMFFLIYLATTLDSRDDNGVVVPLNAMIKILIYALAIMVGFFAIQTALGISIAGALNAAIQSNLETIYQLSIWIGIILLFIILFGVMINTMYAAYLWISEKFIRRGSNRGNKLR